MKSLFFGIALISLLGATSLTAGDVSFGNWRFPLATVYVGESEPVEFELKNPLGFDVTGLEINVRIKYGENVVYDQTQEVEKVDKESEAYYRLSTPFFVEFAGTYVLDASFTTDGSDINPTNNETSFSFSAGYRVSLDQAKLSFDAAIGDILRTYKGTDIPSDDQFHYNPMPYVPGTVIGMGGGESSTTLGAHSYLFLFDLAPFQKMAHPVGYVAVNATDTEAEPTIGVGNSWTHVNQMAVPGINSQSYTLYYNYEPPSSTSEDPPIISTPIGSEPVSTTCAILIAGRRNPNGTFDDHTKVFKGDVDSVYKEITSEAGGMKVDPSNVERLYDPSEEDIFNAVERLKTKNCTKVVFYYSGHGFKASDEDKYTSLFLKQSAYPGLPMFSAMDIVGEIGAKDFVFIFDCCYAGDAIRQKPVAENLASKNVIILASSHKDSLSKTDLTAIVKDGVVTDTVGRSSYTKALLKHWGTTGVSTPLQAHNAVVKENPDLLNDKRKMNEAMKPQSYGTETKPAANGNISFDDLDLNFQQAMGFDGNAMITVTTWGPIDDFGSSDQSITDVDSYRLWNISLSGQMGDFSTSLLFRYDAELDGVAGQTLGIIRRSGGGAWSAIPTEINAEDQTLLVRTISSFSDWAVATTTLDPVSVEEDAKLGSLILSLRSSVARSSITFDLSSSISGIFEGALVSVSTGQVLSRFTISSQAGTATHTISTANLVSGTYLITLEGATKQGVSVPFVVVR